jgi:hypothetical protein
MHYGRSGGAARCQRIRSAGKWGPAITHCGFPQEPRGSIPKAMAAPSRLE